VNRPHPSLALPEILEGMLRFARSYQGELATETMLVRGANDDERSIEAVAAFVERLGPRVAYVAVPTRPPAEAWVEPPTEEVVHLAYQSFAARLPRVELLTADEGDEIASAGDPIADLLATVTIHPLREDVVIALLDRAGGGRELLERLVAEGRLRAVRYRDRTFYLRPIGALRS
jgi:wyosine [tRNA(Phe)-imidazoG37] synthetase (radical SAM superfamily)